MQTRLKGCNEELEARYGRKAYRAACIKLITLKAIPGDVRMHTVRAKANRTENNIFYHAEDVDHWYLFNRSLRSFEHLKKGR